VRIAGKEVEQEKNNCRKEQFKVTRVMKENMNGLRESKD